MLNFDPTFQNFMMSSQELFLMEKIPIKPQFGIAKEIKIDRRVFGLKDRPVAPKYVRCTGITVQYHIKLFVEQLRVFSTLQKSMGRKTRLLVRRCRRCCYTFKLSTFRNKECGFFTGSASEVCVHDHLARLLPQRLNVPQT